MKPHKPTRPAWQEPEFDKPLLTASYFGFIPMIGPKILDTDIENTAFCQTHPHFDATERAAFIRTYLEANMAELSHPLALAYKRKKKGGYTLHYIGAPTGIAEATLIRTACSMLGDIGHKNLAIEINSVGDKDSLAVYERELGNFLRKNTQNPLSTELKEALREDIFNLFRRDDEEAIALRTGAPPSINFLSSQSRSHFKEVLEFVESLGVEFSLSPRMIGEKNHASHTIFGIKPAGLEAESKSDDLLAVGYRYSRLGKKLGMKKDVPMASVTIFAQDKKDSGKTYTGLPKAKFFLIQMGREAKMRSLGIIETLRREKIPVHHFLGKDKLPPQLQGAEEASVPYLIIIGHKEALDGTATIRNIQTRAQDTIPLEHLVQYLKKISL